MVRTRWSRNLIHYRPLTDRLTNGVWRWNHFSHHLNGQKSRSTESHANTRFA